MSNTPDANASATPPQSEASLDLDKVSDENKAIAAALRKAQLDNQALTSQLKDMRIHGPSKQPTSSISSNSTKSSAATETWRVEVKKSGQKFMVMHRPWNPFISSYVGEIEEAKITNPYDVLRYTNNVIQTQCEFAEIFSAIPKTLEHHEMLAGRLPDYIKIFQQGISTGRTNAVAKLKTAAGEIYSEFHRVHPNFFVSRQDCKGRSENAEARKLLSFNASDKSYALLLPLLYLQF
ncbi:hypothetical protein AAF712_015948 [Marasmius tenuissimus]|uniref:Uncharacterized protein n=1 Tax=Marasmius tenuissimus TaxID=585030 RepID=A0ABR2Z846_9AGAR